MKEQLVPTKASDTTNSMILQELHQLRTLVERQGQLNKPVLSVEECAELLGLSTSYLYRLTSEKRIPFYKPNGKRIFFHRDEILGWALSERITPDGELRDTIRSHAHKARRR
ncbi:hypothetical protein Q672_10475 [Marinobacter sp. EVN1]|uniref:excisionase family DNA-binding protein n=1 Tax=unclassified Marinobacter TaxID=83889 RepID=UPI0003B8D8D8|nr:MULTISPECIES: helix-turn-helix domain-containing protein [unclassified Marinobacter]ERS88598.1 hypothetical protein Q672_10475 [Marinobacter sp. EVN1]MBC7192655.1 helix-turn-helix domain-containing protein [Marinobacter sp.]